jgi:hypothetical protein
MCFVCNHWNKNVGRVGVMTGLCLIMLGVAGVRAQMVDLNGNGMSDVWEWIYGANGIDPNADSDGDGFSNLQEAIAGTNPFDSNSYPYIPIVFYSPTNFLVTIPGALGKQYQLQSVAALGSTNWFVETNLVVRSGTNVTLTALPASEMKFYRVAISDVNSDGSGLMNDWEKYQLGLDPSNASSNATLDGNGSPMTDYQYVTAMLAQQNVITIAATDPVTTQPDPGQSPTDLGVFTVTRGGFPLNSITVNLATGGPGTGFATAGLDYSNNLPASITLPAGASAKTITLTPLANTNLQVPVIAQLKLLPGANYSAGSQGSASVVIYPSSTAKGTGLLGQYFTNANLTYASTTNFNSTNLFLTRVDSTIDFTWTNGTAPNLSNGVYSVRWTGQVQPQYSETCFFDTVSDDGVKLWVNDQLLIDKWQTQNGGSEWTNAIVLQGGTRYDLKLEYLQYTNKAQAHLYWYSADQSRQIIPNTCLYPTNNFVSSTSNAPAAITSALSAVGFVGQPFSFTVTGANTPLGFTATNLPPGLNFNSTNGLINGTPVLAGDYQTVLTASARRFWTSSSSTTVILSCAKCGQMFPVQTSPTFRWPRRPTSRTPLARSKASRILATITASACAAISPRRSRAIIISGSPAAIRRNCGFPTTANQSTKFCAPTSRRRTTRRRPAKTEPHRASGICSLRKNRAGLRSSRVKNTISKFCTRPAPARATTGRSAGCKTRPARTTRPPASRQVICSRVIIRRCPRTFPARCIPRTCSRCRASTAKPSVRRRCA